MPVPRFLTTLLPRVDACSFFSHRHRSRSRQLPRFISSNGPSKFDFDAQQRADHDHNIWGSAASQYRAAFSDKFVSYADRALHEVLGNGPGDTKVFRLLDVGCGAGAVSEAALKRLRSTTGMNVLGPGCLEELHLTSIDFSSEFVDDAEQSFGELLRRDSTFHADRMGHFTFHQMDGMDLGFPDSSFNGVTAMFSVMFFPDPVQGLREIHRVLCREGGVAVVSSWAPVQDVEWVWFSNKAIVRIMREHPDKFTMPEGMAREQRKHNAFIWDMSEKLAGDMAKAGFCADAVDVKTVKKRFAIQSRQDAKTMWTQMAIAFPTVDYFIKAVQCTNSASEEMFRELVADRYADLIVDRNPDDLYVEGTAYFAIGRK